MRSAHLVGALGAVLMIGSILLGQSPRSDRAPEPLDGLYDAIDEGSPDALQDLLPPEPDASAATGLPTASGDAIVPTVTTQLGPPVIPGTSPTTTNTGSPSNAALSPIPANANRRSSMANQPYTLAGILDDENKHIDCLCEQEFCERMRQCAGNRNQGWGLFRNWDLFWGRTPRNRDNSMQCWQCSARMQQQQMQQLSQGPNPSCPGCLQGSTGGGAIQPISPNSSYPISPVPHSFYPGGGSSNLWEGYGSPAMPATLPATPMASYPWAPNR